MHVVELTEPRNFEHSKRPRPTPNSGEVLVQIRHVGICGSDVHYFEHGRIGDYVVESPLILGHESAGEVVEVGSGVDHLSPGDRVSLEPGIPCGECARCRAGTYNLCPDVVFMATPPDDGAFAEFVSWDADFAYRLPEPVSTRAGALCEPLSVGIHATRRGEIGLGDTVLVTGAGPIGMMVLKAARAAGASDVLVSDVVPSKLDRARNAGAATTVNVADEDLTDAVAAFTDGEGVDVVVEASGAAAAIASTTEVVRRGGTIVCIGLSQNDDIPIATNELVDKELDLRGSFRFRNTYHTAISLLEQGAIEVEDIIDFEMSMRDLTAAFERAQEPDVCKGMVELPSE
ncbi:NAD(P)-dependent alcohol dehydrogenase (plasmid) [Haloferax mediterranei ATCC 33500]|nr:NAD(P)-dependent alcohol dehydrogenase [Haloferax mediterranei]AFK21378.1 zinc-binding dehydrogenase [Haloferax mediterranei ATCC 33500]AHZ24547.1 alcohol dehydrogenase [Haloferax mediterranei ATCC 33500]QCQ77093.1 NAD(P)-dependent alcohol dehydrogenase [Haloferax mediterranei ATCC 33500]